MDKNILFFLFYIFGAQRFIFCNVPKNLVLTETVSTFATFEISTICIKWLNGAALRRLRVEGNFYLTMASQKTSIGVAVKSLLKTMGAHTWLRKRKIKKL